MWQDLSSWNVEFAQVYPQYTLESINRLEREFLHALHWDLYISGSLYAKYYFALRSMSERKNFRRRYMYIMKVNAPGGRRIAVSLLLMLCACHACVHINRSAVCCCCCASGIVTNTEEHAVLQERVVIALLLLLWLCVLERVESWRC